MMKFLHSYVNSNQDLEEEKVALSKYTSSDAYLNNTILEEHSYNHDIYRL